MSYGNFKDLPGRTASDKILCDKAFNIAKIQSVMDINTNLFQWFIVFLKKKLVEVLLKMKICQTKN